MKAFVANDDIVVAKLVSYNTILLLHCFDCRVAIVDTFPNCLQSLLQLNFLFTGKYQTFGT